MSELCHCGRPLHYTDPSVHAQAERLIARTGSATVQVTDSQGRTWSVPRHYIALHGIKEQELATLGFERLGEAP